MNHPLVSVGILAYNSSKYIIDALESVKNQTYEKIELIVSDDCSTDNTVEKCRSWIEENKSRFVNATLLTVEKNTGTSANGNRVIAACKGEWIRIFAGDDALFPESINSFVKFIDTCPEAKVVVGNIKVYRYTFDEANIDNSNFSSYIDNDNILNKSAEEQLKKMVYGNTFILPAVFCNAGIMKEVGGYDEKYGILEDFPFYLKVLKAGYKFYKLDEYVLKYRSSDTNVFERRDVLFNYRLRYYDYLVKRDMCFPYYSFYERIRTHTSIISYWIMNKLGMRKNNTFNRCVQVFLHLVFAVLTLDVKQLYSYFQAAMRLL